MDANLISEKVKTANVQKEAVHEQQRILKGDSKSNLVTLDTVKAAHKVVILVQVSNNTPTRPTAEKQTHNVVARCGRGSHK